MHVDDLAAACLLLLEKYDSPEIINLGCGEDISIRELAELICDVVGFDGELVWDKTKPDGTPRKLLDVTRTSRARLEADDPAARWALPGRMNGSGPTTRNSKDVASRLSKEQRFGQPSVSDMTAWKPSFLAEDFRALTRESFRS